MHTNTYERLEIASIELGILYNQSKHEYCFSVTYVTVPYSIYQPCSNTSTTAGDGEDNDCDGWIDEETDNGIGNEILLSLISVTCVTLFD